MTSAQALTTVVKRVVLCVHEYYQDEYESICSRLVQFCGYSAEGETYDWVADHYVHLGGANDGPFHLTVDMG
jgi:hypothetical protein